MSLTNLTQYEISFHLIFLHNFESLSSYVLIEEGGPTVY